MTTGVLALQGAFGLHRQVFSRLNVDAVEVRTIAELRSVSRLVIPGGESSVMAKLADESGMLQVLSELIDNGLPVLGTCAGAIMLASEIIDGRVGQPSVGALDISVRRNAFGRQAESFTTQLKLVTEEEHRGPGRSFEAVFIRAPAIERIGASIEILAEFEGNAVMVRQGSMLATTFHPELSGDDTVHQLFLSL